MGGGGGAAGPAGGLPPPRLACVQSSYRQVAGPLLGFISGLEQEHPGRTVAVIVPELVKEHWWQYVLHNRRAARLRRALLRQGEPMAGGDRVALVFEGLSKSWGPVS